MANSIEWQTPIVTYEPGSGGEAFISGVVPALTPETFDAALATEEFERAEANAKEIEAAVEIDALNEMFNRDLGEEIINGDSNEA